MSCDNPCWIWEEQKRTFYERSRWPNPRFLSFGSILFDVTSGIFFVVTMRGDHFEDPNSYRYHKWEQLYTTDSVPTHMLLDLCLHGVRDEF